MRVHKEIQNLGILAYYLLAYWNGQQGWLAHFSARIIINVSAFIIHWPVFELEEEFDTLCDTKDKKNPWVETS